MNIICLYGKNRIIVDSDNKGVYHFSDLVVREVLTSIIGIEFSKSGCFFF